MVCDAIDEACHASSFFTFTSCLYNNPFGLHCLLKVVCYFCSFCFFFFFVALGTHTSECFTDFNPSPPPTFLEPDLLNSSPVGRSLLCRAPDVATAVVRMSDPHICHLYHSGLYFLTGVPGFQEQKERASSTRKAVMSSLLHCQFCLPY